MWAMWATMCVCSVRRFFFSHFISFQFNLFTEIVWARRALSLSLSLWSARVFATILAQSVRLLFLFYYVFIYFHWHWLYYGAVVVVHSAPPLLLLLFLWCDFQPIHFVLWHVYGFYNVTFGHKHTDTELALSHSHTHTRSFIHLLSNSFTLYALSLPILLAHSLICSLVHSLIRSLA